MPDTSFLRSIPEAMTRDDIILRKWLINILLNYESNVSNEPERRIRVKNY